MYPLHRPRLVGVKAQYCALSWSTERNPMTIQVWCSIEVFHQSDASTISAMVNTDEITRDILFMPSASCADGAGFGRSNRHKRGVPTNRRHGTLGPADTCRLYASHNPCSR